MKPALSACTASSLSSQPPSPSPVPAHSSIVYHMGDINIQYNVSDTSTLCMYMADCLVVSHCICMCRFLNEFVHFLLHLLDQHLRPKQTHINVVCMFMNAYIRTVYYTTIVYKGYLYCPRIMLIYTIPVKQCAPHIHMKSKNIVYCPRIMLIYTISVKHCPTHT